MLSARIAAKILLTCRPKCPPLLVVLGSMLAFALVLGHNTSIKSLVVLGLSAAVEFVCFGYQNVCTFSMIEAATAANLSSAQLAKRRVRPRVRPIVKVDFSL
jgi:hypothetical protein